MSHMIKVQIYSDLLFHKQRSPNEVTEVYKKNHHHIKPKRFFPSVASERGGLVKTGLKPARPRHSGIYFLTS